MIWILYALLALLIVFLAVILTRACLFKPKASAPVDAEEISVDNDRAVDHLAQMIRVKTVSHRDDSLVDWERFSEFRALLRELYPAITSACTIEEIGKSGVLYHLKGTSDANPSVFMAHYDVVPVNEDAWTKPPFDAVIENGVLWGRGTLDTKITLLGVMEAAEDLLNRGFTPQNDMYFAFSGDEEIMGDSAPAIVAELERRGIKPGIVVDEGGAVVEGVFPGVSSPCALVGTGEKGLMDLDFSIKAGGGHASSPPPHTSIGKLASAVTRMENKPFSAFLTKPAAEMFDTLGRHSTFAYRIIFANLWCFFPVLNSMCKKQGGEMNALLRTTCAFTMMSGSQAHNVLPPYAMVGANLRLNNHDTLSGALAYLKSVAADEDIEFNMVYGMEASIASDTHCESWDKLSSAIASTWKGSIVSPYLMVACSDSRHYCRICDKVYRFSAMALSSEERRLIHGNDERIPVEKIGKTVEFYRRLLAQF